MLNLLMTIMVWLLSMSMFQWTMIHETIRQNFALITPTLMQQTVRFEWVSNTMIAYFDSEHVANLIPEFFEKNYTSFRTLYSFAFLYEKEEELCSVQCDYVRISLTYDNGTQSFLLTRSFQLYGP